MSLPTFNGGDPRPATHTPIALERLTQLATKLEDALAAEGEDKLTPDLVEIIAGDLGAPEAHVYAAAATLTDIACDSGQPIRFEVCVGGCQSWGAVQILDHLLLRHAERRADELPVFSVVAKRCLDKCAHAPVVLVHTQDGSAGISRATSDKIDEALEQLFD